MEETLKSKSGYSSRFALLCVLIGGSVGTGNLWRFPRLVAGNGGGAFILVMVVCVFLSALPLLYVENFMGRASRHAAPAAFRDVVGPKYTWMGMFSTVVYILMTAYYMVVLAWCLYYAGMSLTKSYFGVDKTVLFDSVTNGNPVTVVIWITALVLLYIGISKQQFLERVASVLLPLLFAILIGLVVYALTRPGAMEGLKYAFRLEPKALVDIATWKEALTQCAWSIGPGTMMMITAAMVSDKNGDIALNTHVQAFGDMTVALLGTVCVLPIIFVNAVSVDAATTVCQQGNNGLTFLALTGMFESMPAGNLVGTGFFLCLSFAAFTSATLMTMCGVNVLIDAGMSRKKASLILVVFMGVVGIPSVLSQAFLTNQDNVWGFGLVFGSLFLGIAAMKFGAEKIRSQFVNPVSDLRINRSFNLLAPLVAPLLITLVLAIWLFESLSWTENPWTLFSTSSTGTILYQWAAVAIICILASKWYNKKIKHTYYNGENFPDMPDGLL